MPISASARAFPVRAVIRALALVILSACAAARPHPADAQPAVPLVDAPRFQAFLDSDAHKALINRAAAAMPPSVFEICPQLASSGLSATIRKPISFDAAGVPKAGAWVEHVPIAGCGNNTVLNFFFEAGADGKINTTIGFPGSTRADPVLQRDALQYASLGAGLRIKDCQRFDIKTTRFEAYGLRKPTKPDPGEKARLRPWWETWTVVGCGRTVEVPMNFEPDATGTQITQVASEVSEPK